MANDLVRVAVIQVDGEWKPGAWNDWPRTGIVVSVSKQAYDPEVAEGFLYAFNRHATEKRMKHWSVLIPAEIGMRPGESCLRQHPLYK